MMKFIENLWSENSSYFSDEDCGYWIPGLIADEESEQSVLEAISEQRSGYILGSGQNTNK